MLYAWDSKVHVDGKTSIMVVPQGNTNGYRIIDLDRLIDTQAFYDVTFYNVNKGGYAALMVVKQPFENLGGASVGVIDSVSTFMNDEGDNLVKNPRPAGEHIYRIYYCIAGGYFQSG